MRKIISVSLFLFTLILGIGATSAHAATGWSFITLNDYYAFPGETIRVNGKGFDAYETVTVTAFGKNKNFITDSTGSFSGETNAIPFEDINSIENISVKGTNGNSGFASVVIGSYYPVVEPSNYYIIPGGEVSFSGGQFAPNEKIKVTRDGTQIGFVTAKNNGSFETASIPVAYTGGRQVYKFEGQSSGVKVSRAINVAEVQPYILLNRYYDRPGTSVQIVGRAFGANESISINVGGKNVSVASDSMGRFSAVVDVPNVNSSKLNIKVTGRATGVVATEQFTLARN